MASREKNQKAAAAANVAKAAAAASEAAEPREVDPLAYNVSLPEFEGPLDLLLHLIQSHELDILNIPMSFITKRYLDYLSLMKSMSIDIASEYLVMAAVLVHIKSKMLLPVVPKGQDDDLEEEELDPREELVRRLLEYQKYKNAAADLGNQSVLGQDVFLRPAVPVEKSDEIAPLAEVPIYRLFDAFSKLLEGKKIKVEHEVTFDRLSITDRINQIVTLLQERKKVTFEQLFESEGGANQTRFDIILTFLSLLEMTKLRMTRLFQADALATIHIELALSEGDDLPDLENLVVTADGGAGGASTSR
jgi:segregation and condensation protein A